MTDSNRRPSRCKRERTAEKASKTGKIAPRIDRTSAERRANEPRFAIDGLLKVSGPAHLDHLEETFPIARLRSIAKSAAEAYVLQEIDSLSYLFNSADIGFGDRESLIELRPLLNSRITGALQIRRHVLDRRLVGAVEQLTGMGSRGESWEHHWLKRIAQQWLRSRGDQVHREAQMFGGRVDVYGEPSDTIIEVGSTAYSRALMALTSSAKGPFFIIPFSRCAGEVLNTDPRESVVAFEFVVSPRDRVRLRRSLAVPFSTPAPENPVPAQLNPEVCRTFWARSVRAIGGARC